MERKQPQDNQDAQSEMLTHELDEAELFVQKLRSCIIAIRDELAAGQTGRALSMCNQVLTDIDSATDVVAQSPHAQGPPRRPVGFIHDTGNAES